MERPADRAGRPGVNGCPGAIAPPRGLLLDAADDPAEVVKNAVISMSDIPALSHIPVVDAARLAVHICAHLEHAGYPITCLANGDVVVASPHSEELLDEALAQLDLIDHTVDQMQAYVEDLTRFRETCRQSLGRIEDLST